MWWMGQGVRAMLQALNRPLDVVGGALRSKASELGARGTNRTDWLKPLGLAFAVRVALFLLGNVGLRLLQPRRYDGSFGIWDKFDTVWYVHIAVHGYDVPAKNIANFFPLYPMLIWPFGHLFYAIGLHNNGYVVAGMLVSWAAFLAASVILYRLVMERFGSAVALSSLLLLSVFPFSFFYGAAYTESIFLLAAVLAFYAIEHKRWWLASAAACFAGPLRPPGILIGATVVLAYALDWLRTRHGWRWDLLWLALTPLGTLAYLVFCWIRFGDPLAYQQASEQGWHGGHLQLTAINIAINLLLHPGSWLGGTNFMNILGGIYTLLFVVFLVSVVFIFRLLGPHYAFFVFANMVAPLVTFSTLTSTGRYLSILFPSFIVGAYYLRKRPMLQQVLVIVSSLFLAMFTLAFLFRFYVD